MCILCGFLENEGLRLGWPGRIVYKAEDKKMITLNYQARKDSMVARGRS
jgi:hypothetical protein